jgi:hypothetical protein
MSPSNSGSGPVGEGRELKERTGENQNSPPPGRLPAILTAAAHKYPVCLASGNTYNRKRTILLQAGLLSFPADRSGS